jgi:hypothetical protein
MTADAGQSSQYPLPRGSPTEVAQMFGVHHLWQDMSWKPGFVQGKRNLLFKAQRWVVSWTCPGFVDG